jgi:lysophospholipase L1-like esterase
LKLIIDTLRRDNPYVVVLVAKLIPVRDSMINPLIDEINSRVDTIAGETNSVSSPVIIVDHNSGFDDEVDMDNWLHPNERGERKMADKWFEAIRNILEL